MEKRLIAFYKKNCSNYIDKTKLIKMNFQYNFFEKYKPKAGARLLDAGFGSGRDTIHFMGYGYETFSVDLISEFVDAFRGIGIKNVYTMDVMNLPYENFFDVIWANDLLPMFPLKDYDELFKNFSNLLRNKGIVYISQRSSKKCLMPGDTEGVSFFNEKEDITIHISKYFDLLAMEDFVPESSYLENQTWFQYILRKK